MENSPDHEHQEILKKFEKSLPLLAGVGIITGAVTGSLVSIDTLEKIEIERVRAEFKDRYGYVLKGAHPRPYLDEDYRKEKFMPNRGRYPANFVETAQASINTTLVDSQCIASASKIAAIENDDPGRLVSPEKNALCGEAMQGLRDCFFPANYHFTTYETDEIEYMRDAACRRLAQTLLFNEPKKGVCTYPKKFEDPASYYVAPDIDYQRMGHLRMYSDGKPYYFILHEKTFFPGGGNGGDGGSDMSIRPLPRPVPPGPEESTIVRTAEEYCSSMYRRRNLPFKPESSL